MSHQPIPQNQHQSHLPQCQVCKFQPAPQSSQHLALTLIEVILVFINIKFSIILVCLGYCFSQTIWKCPMCKRQVPVDKYLPQNLQAENNIIIRLGKCIGMMSKNKFRVVASIIICLVLYLYTQEVTVYKSRVKVEKTWHSLVQNCGYAAYQENSLRANHFYSDYAQSGNDWVLQGIYLSNIYFMVHGLQFQRIFIKMDPSQFADSQTPDFIALIQLNAFKQIGSLQKGDLLKVYGQWEGRSNHQFHFNAFKIQKTGQKKDPNTVQILNTGSLRVDNK